MRFALADVPRMYTGQEVSAQDVNNFVQNVELLEQIAYSPDKLFLSSWRMAPPVFRLHYNSSKAYKRPDTDNKYFAEINLKSVDVWEGSFLYREGMYRLRLGFQAQALVEDGPNYFTYPINLNDLTANANKSISLFLTIKYTGIPLDDLLKDESTLKKYVKTWVFDSTKASTYKQPDSNSVDSFTFTTGASSDTYLWTPAGVTLDNYHTFEIDINKLGFTPGEIVQVSFRIATRDLNPVVFNGVGNTYYFSMVYANVQHNYFQESWTNITNFTTLNQLPTLAQNQRILVNYFKTLDNPLRAAIWDQVMAGSSYFSFFSKWTDELKSLLINWGLADDLDFLLLNHYSQQARYYVQRNWKNNDVINLSYAVTVNSHTAFTLQGILSKEPTPSRHYRYSVKLTAESSSIPQFIVAEPEDWTGWDPAFYNQNPRAYADLLLRSPFRYFGDTNYKRDAKKNNPAYYYQSDNFILDNHIARRGYFRFIGTYKNTHGGDQQQTFNTPFYDPSITYKNNIAGVTLDSGDFIFYKKSRRYIGLEFGGFYFVRPSPAGDGGVPYYSSTSSNQIGTSFDFFLGPIATAGANTSAYQYVDSWNYNLTNKNSTEENRFYPAVFDAHFNNVQGHSTFFITHAANDYTDFSVDVHEASANWSNSKGPIGYAGFNESYSKRMFNKASYISTIRIAEASVKKSSFTVQNKTRFSSFDQVSYSELIEYLNDVNNRMKEVYNRVFGNEAVHTLKYTPLFWMKPKSMLNHYESYLIPEDRDGDKLWKSMEANSVYFSQTRQADYLVVRGKNVSIGWNGFTKVYRDNPANNFLPSPLEVEFAESQNLTGQDIETVIISLANLKGLTYGQRYYLQGDVYYAAETMGVP